MPDDPITNMIERGTKARQMTNAQLVWALIHTKAWSESPEDSFEKAILNEITERLYPEFDGENVILTDTGWSTPEGEVNYV